MTPRRQAVASVAVLALALTSGAVVEWSRFTWSMQHIWLPDLLTGATLLVAAWVAWQPLRSRATGLLLLLAGLFWFLGTLSAPFVLLHRGPLGHLVLTYPRLRSSRRLTVGVVAAYAVCLVPGLWTAANTVAVAGALVTFAVVAYRRSVGPVRRTRRYALAAAVALAVGLLLPWIGLPVEGQVGYGAAIGVAAVLFDVGLRDRVGSVADVVVELRPQSGGSLRGRLAAALEDPSLELGFWSASTGDYRDDAGEPIPASAVPGRVVTELAREGRPFAVLVHAPEALDDPRVAAAVRSAALLADAQVGLRSEVAEQVRTLLHSRRKLVLAADQERARLARSLRGGALARLEEVSGVLDDLELDLASDPESGGDAVALEAVIEARVRARATLAHLDELGRGLHPSQLAELGLDGAIRASAADSGLVSSCDLDAVAVPEPVELTLWFVYAEALANAMKHAHATYLSVTVRTRDGRVRLEVADDGVGGADLTSGSGLAGLVDRVEALGGSLTLESPPGAGTRVSAVLPLEPLSA